MATKEVAVKQATEVGLPADFMAELAKEAKDAAAQERPAIGKFSTQAGQLKYGGEVVAGNNLDVVILYASHRNLYFAGAFDRNNIKNPDCFSLAETDEGMVPDPNAANPQNGTCAGCSKNQWGSDVGPGGEKKKGKACKESRRLVMMPASQLDADDAILAIQSSELGILDLPVTSAKNYGALVNTVAATVGVPVWATVVNVKVQPSKNQFEVVLTPLRTLPSKAVADAVKARIADAKRIALEPYDETSPTNSAVQQANAEREAAAGKKF